MNPPAPSGQVHSIQERLKNKARRADRPYVELLELFAVERFLYRLARSRHREQFILKGTLLIRHWLGADSRPTRDIDLLGPVDIDADRLRANLKELLALEVEEDGIAYQPESIAIAPIRVESPILGLRAHFDATLGVSLHGLHKSEFLFRLVTLTINSAGGYSVSFIRGRNAAWRNRQI